MKNMLLLLALCAAGCGTGQQTSETAPDGAFDARGISPLLAGEPEKLRERVLVLIGEGAGSEAALEIIDRYEADLGFMLGERSSGATIADSAAASEAALYSGIQTGIVGGDPRAGRKTVTAPPSSERIRRFVRNSLAVALIGLNECHQNFSETGNDRFARRGLAHGYIALISDPSPSQESDIIGKMRVLQVPFLK